MLVSSSAAEDFSQPCEDLLEWWEMFASKTYIRNQKISSSYTLLAITWAKLTRHMPVNRSILYLSCKNFRKDCILFMLCLFIFDQLVQSFIKLSSNCCLSNFRSHTPVTLWGAVSEQPRTWQTLCPLSLVSARSWQSRKVRWPSPSFPQISAEPQQIKQASRASPGQLVLSSCSTAAASALQSQ